MTEMHLARLFGLFLTIFALGVLFNREHVSRAAQDIAEHDGLQVPAALIPLLIGCYLVVTHNHWVWGWPLVLTLFGWMTLLGGAFRCLFVRQWVAMLKNLNKGMPIVAGLILLIFGVLLLIFGFFVTG